MQGQASSNLGSRDNLSSSAFALGCAFDDTRKIQDLDLGASIFEHTRDSRKGGKRVSCDFALRLGDFGEKGGLSNRGKSHERYPRITAFADIEAASTARSGTSSRLEKLSTETGKFSGQGQSGIDRLCD